MAENRVEKVVGGIEAAENIYALAQGQIPISLILRLIPTFFFRKKKRLTKAQMKKMMMMKRRMFVDNIIMHHKRLHDQNREKVIEETKLKLSHKPIKLSDKPSISPNLVRTQEKTENRWRTKVKPKQGEFRTRVKGMVDNDRERSRSKWTSRVDNSGNIREV